MSYHIFKESEVRAAILKKAPYEIKSGKRSKHDTAFLIVNNKKISHFRIPNSHKKEFYQSKASEMARKLFLDESGYKKFVECSMKQEEYSGILVKKMEEETASISAEISSEK